MKANEEDNERNKEASGGSESGRGNGTANPSPKGNPENETTSNTLQKDLHGSSSAELQDKEQSLKLSEEGRRPPSLGAGGCGDLPFFGADYPCVRQPLLGADEPSPRVKMKFGQSTSAGKLTSSLQELRSLGRMGSVQVSLGASGKEIQNKDWDAKKVLTGASASMILSSQSDTGWMNTYKITDETAVEPSTAPFLLHSGVKDPKTLSETLISKKVGAEREGVQLEAMFYMNRKNRLDTHVEIEKYKEKVLSSMPASPDRDLELSQIEILRDYENKFFDEHEESILQKIKENDKQIEIEAGKRDLIAFYEARVDMIETAEEMKTWVQNGINEIQKMKTRNVIPTAKKSTFTKGVSEKVKAWVHRVGRILQTSLQMAKRTRDEKIFHTKEIKELLETLDEEASEIYKWKKAGKKLLEGLENPEVAAEEARQAGGDGNQEDGKGDGDTPARVQTSTPRPEAESTPIRSKTFYRSRTTTPANGTGPPLLERTPIQENLVAMAETGGEMGVPTERRNSPEKASRPHLGQEAPARMGFQYTGPPAEWAEKSPGNNENCLYDESTVELSGSQIPSPTGSGDARTANEKTGKQDGWYEEDIRPQVKEAMEARRRWEREDEGRDPYLRHPPRRREGRRPTSWGERTEESFPKRRLDENQRWEREEEARRRPFASPRRNLGQGRTRARGLATNGEEPIRPYSAAFRRRAYEIEEVARREEIERDKLAEEEKWEKIREKIHRRKQRGGRKHRKDSKGRQTDGSSSSDDSIDYEFYDSLPSKWRVIPVKATSKTIIIDPRKPKTDEIMNKWKGVTADYVEWRYQFIEYVHRIDHSNTHKTLILKRLLDTENGTRDVRILYARLMDGRDYRRAILYMEKVWGGDDNVLRDVYARIGMGKPMDIKNMGDLKKLDTEIQKYVTAVRDARPGYEIGADLGMRNVLSNRLDRKGKYAWHKHLRMYRLEGSVEDFLDWIGEKIDIMEDTKRAEARSELRFEVEAGSKVGGAGPRKDFRRRGAPFGKPRERALVAEDEDDKEESSETGGDESEGEDDCLNSGEEDEIALQAKMLEKCDECGETHYLTKCPKYMGLSKEGRKEALIKHKRCFRCLGNGHMSRKCKRTCRICSERHHWTLCFKGDENGIVKGTGMLTAEGLSVSLKTIRVKLRNAKEPKRMIEVNALFDSGCSGVLLDQKAGEKLHLTGHPFPVHTAIAYNRTVESMAFYADVVIESVDGKTKKKASVRVGDNPAGNLRGVDWSSKKSEYQYLKHLPIESLTSDRRISMMIGVDQPELSRNLGVPDICPPKGVKGPDATYTPFGWVVAGAYPSKEGEENNLMEIQQELKRVQEESLQMTVTKEAETLAKRDICFFLKFGELENSETNMLTSDQRLERLITKWIEAEHFDPGELKTTKTLEEEYIKEKLEKGRKIAEDGRHIIPCTWKEKEPNFADNRRYVVEDFKRLEKSKHWRDERIRKAYAEKIEGYVEKGYAEEVKDLKTIPPQRKYIPQFPVVDWSKDSTPLRPVFDGKRKTPPDNKSLNDALLPGPNLANDLPTVLSGIRRAPIVFGTDIREMFLQIRLTEEDSYCHLFVFRGDPKDELKTYRFLRHPFGSAGSPCVAIYTAKRLAKDFEKKYPLAASMILSSSIVDDIMGSAENEKEAIRVLEQLREIFASARMKAAKIFSNSEKVLKSFPIEDTAAKLQLIQHDMEQNPKLSTLGMSYLPKTDQIGYKMKVPDWSDWTPRKILQVQARLYDPLGLSSPFIVTGRLIFRRAKEETKEWDQPVSKEISEEWGTWMGELKNKLETLTFDRCLRSLTGKVTRQTLHIFTDASHSAMAAVGYLRTEYSNEETTVRIGMSKTKLVPKDSNTMPRSELNAMLLCIPIKNTLTVALQLKEEQIFYYSDSEVALAWMKNTTLPLYEYVYNRVTKMRTQTNPLRWSYVNTKENPADLPSRGTTLEELTTRKIWKNGPDFLQLGEEKWPKPSIPKLPQNGYGEVKGTLDLKTQDGRMGFEDEDLQDEAAHPPLGQAALLLQQKTETKMDPNHFTSYNKMVRTWMQLIKFIQKLRKVPNTNEEYTHLWKEAERKILKYTQKQYFKREITLLKDGKDIPLTSSLSKMNIFLDGEGVIRKSIRLNQDMLNIYHQGSNPIVLPKGAALTKLLIKHYHENVMQHTLQVDATRYELSRTYYSPRLRCQIKAIIRNCHKCKITRPKPLHQRMAPIHPNNFPKNKERTYPYQTTCMDLAGPFSISSGRGRKRQEIWILLFMCPFVRAVTLEIVYDLSTTEFLLALKRFVARRGEPKVCLSDNGTNFRGAAREVTDYWTKLEHKRIQENHPKVQFKFIPPASPHHGGIWERMVGTVKRALRGVLPAVLQRHSKPRGEELYGGRKFEVPPVLVKESELRTALAVIEAIVNKRPLTYQSQDGDELMPLTPSHFLCGRETYEFCPGLELAKGTGREAWGRLNDILDHFWKRLVKEVLPSQGEWDKWQREVRNLRVGDVVVILDGRRKGEWCLGKITNTFPGQDGLVRVLEVRTQFGLYVRPVTKVSMVLPVEDDHPWEGWEKVAEIADGRAEQVVPPPPSQKTEQVLLPLAGGRPSTSH